MLSFEHTIAANESYTFHLGPYPHSGLIVFNSSPPDLYVSSFFVGNINKILGSPTPLEHFRDLATFPAGVPVTMQMHNRGEHAADIGLAFLPA
jgi:hypothetical protein